MVKTIGRSAIPNEINLLYRQGLDYIQHYEGPQTFDFTRPDFKYKVKQSIRNISIEGIHLLLGKIYSEIGFDKRCDNLLTQLVLVHLLHPASKLKTTQYLPDIFLLT